VFRVERTWTSAPAPLSIVRPAHHAIPPKRRHVFVNYCESAFAQHATDFIQHELRIVGVMQHVTKQDRIKALIAHRKMPPIVREIVNASRGNVAHVNSHDGRTEHALQVMGYETVATTNVEHVCAGRQNSCDFERHVVSASNFTASSHALDATFERGS